MKITNYNRGFTVVELLVAILMFSLVFGGAMNLLFSALRVQRNALAQEHVLSQGSYLAEYMGRALRQARKELAASPNNCLTTAGRGFNYEINASADRIRFLNKDNRCQEFYLAGSAIQERISTNNVASNFGSPVALTSEDVAVGSLKFALAGETQADSIQPRATMFLQINDVQLQTSVSQRIFDVEQ
ncbi:MAG: prepilin-type N-terminal cleavage/methylation domain-containing protein [Candidatus Wildermuthbacteria bacterium]|nr:prepilin-type N-terminal cleavage/methylation domain-containing protein [Candidatus Wildermuthbacteria bacterium]